MEMSYVGLPEGAVASTPFYMEGGQQDKRLGFVVDHRGQRYFYKRVDKERHFFFKHQAWAVQAFVVDQFKALDIDGLVLDVKDDGLIAVDAERFQKLSILDDYGHGEQYFLHENLWHPFAWPPSVCGATIEFGDDYGDNETTFHCQLDKGHMGDHMEKGEMYGGQKYVLTWKGDARKGGVSNE